MAAHKNAKATLHDDAAEAATRVRARYSHDELAALFALGPTWTWETDSEHRYSFISPAMEQATGILVADLIGRTRRDSFFVNGSLVPEALRHFEDLAALRPFSDFVFEARSKDGRQSWISVSGMPRFDANGVFTGYLGVSRALSDSAFIQSGLKNASDRIQRMETLLSEVFESVPVGIAIFDAESRFVTCNAHYRDIFAGFADHLVPGTPIMTLLEVAWDRGIIANPHEIDLSDRAAARAEWIARRQKQHKQDDYRDVTVLSDGRHLQQISKRLPDGNFISVRVDITDRVRKAADLEEARAKAAEAERRMLAAIEALPTGFALWDTDGRLAQSNSRFADLIGPGVPVAKGDHYVELLRRLWSAGKIVNKSDEFEDWLANDSIALTGADNLEDIYPLHDGRWIVRHVTTSADGRRVDIRTDITERVRHASDLEEAGRKASLAEEQLSSAIEAFTTGVAIWERDGTLALANSRFRTLSESGDDLRTGDSFETMMRRLWATGRIVDRTIDFEQWLKDDLERMFGEDEIEHTYRLLDGRWVLRRVASTADGRRVDIRTDITAIKQTEERVTEASRVAEDARLRLRSAIDSLSTGFALWDGQDRLVVYNNTLKAMASPFIRMETGETYEEIMRRMVERGLVVAANESGDPAKWLEEVLARRARRQDAEYLYYSQDGRWILQRETMTPAGERVDVRTDITELKSSEARANLALEEAKLARSVIDELEAPIFVKDDKLRFVFCNEAFARIHGVTPAEFEGRRARDFVTDADAQAFEASEADVLRSGEPFEIEEDYFEDGRERARVVRKSRIVTQSGARYVAGYMFEITAMRQRARALEQAMRRAESADHAKSEFLANMSHEIRTPMNGVLSMADLLRQSALDDRQRMFVDVIRRSGETLLGTINNILDYSKIDAGSMTVEAKPFPLRATIEDVACMMAAKAAEKDVRLIIKLAPDLPALAVGDETRLAQILVNLVGNAIKFTDGGEVVVCAGGEVKDGILHFDVCVIDTGCGIPHDQIANVFDRFAQIQGADNARPGGTGLGLSIVAKLVELMGGTISVTSEEGRGSTFRVDLHLACPDPRQPAILVPDAQRGARIIVADASAAQREALVAPLKAWGFEACGVESSRMALALAHAMCERGLPPDMVIFGCNARKDGCSTRASVFLDQWSFAPPALLVLHPLDMAPPTDGIAARSEARFAALPLRQAEFFQHVTAALARRNARSAPHAHPVTPVKPTPGAEAGAASDLPAPAEPAATAAPRETALPPRTAHHSRIDVLVAEDNPVNQLVMGQILDMTGLTYQIVADGGLAVDAYRELKPRLILMDVAMPRLNGYQATAAIRDMVEIGGDRVPIIGVTAHVTDAERDACLRCGMSDHLAKPISPERLLARIAQWLPRQQRREA